MKRSPQLRHSAAEKRELIHLVEHSALPVRRTLDALGLAPSTFYRWYAQFQADAEAGLAPKQAAERQFWNRIPDSVHQKIIQLALAHPEKSARQLAWLFTDQEGYFVSESSVFRLLKGYDLIANPRRSNLEQLRAHGCRRVEYLPFGYNPDYHFIESNPTPAEKVRFGCEVAILGGADADRVPLARALAAANMDLALYGGYWDKYLDLKKFHRGSVFGRDLRLAVQLARCQVCMGRLANRDGHAMRSVEFPAMGACLLVEDTAEHREMYGSDGESVLYWQNQATLVTQVATLIGDSTLNQQLRASLCSRMVVNGNHTYGDRLKTIASFIS